MISITTNIEAVQERIRKLEGELHKALLRALDLREWRNALQQNATEVIRKQWQGERNVALRECYEKMTPLIVGTLMGAVYDTGAWFSMTVPHAAMDLAALWPDLTSASSYNAMIHRTNQPGRPTNLAAGKAGDPALLYPEDHANLERVRQAIVDWCAFEKDLTDEDLRSENGTPRTPREVANGIMDILGVGLFPKARTPAMEEAAKDLVGAVEAWLAGDKTTPGGRPVHTSPEAARAAEQAEAQHYGEAPVKAVHPQVAEQWLAAVLKAWVMVVRERLPLRIEKELVKVRQAMARK